MSEHKIAAVASRAAVQDAREPEVIFVEDAFLAGGAYVRGYKAAELDRWRTAAKRFGGKNANAVGEWIMRLQFAACVLTGPAPELHIEGEGDEAVVFAEIESLTLLEPMYQPTDTDLKALAEDVPPGSLQRLVLISDALVGYSNSEAEAIKSFPRVRTATAAANSGSSSAGGASTDSAGDPETSTG